jgi:transcriptional regulator with XRE-family HTH domain
MSRSRLANYLRTERLRCGLSQSEFGELLGTTRSVICKAERGCRTPSLPVAFAAEIIFAQTSRNLFPELYEAFEQEILLRAVALEFRLAERTDAAAERKRSHLSALINRLQFHQL